MRRPKVAILNEHRTWQVGLCEELRRRDIDFCEIRIQEAHFNISEHFRDIDLVINRASPSAKERHHHAALFFTLQLIEHFEQLGIPVINGSQAYSLEISKARQYQLLQRLGLRFPHTIVVNSSEQAVAAAGSLCRPLVLKPNVGGSGMGYKGFREHDDLTIEEAEKVLAASLDRTAVLQDYVHPDDDKSYRVQMIGTTHLYTVSAEGGGANKCLAADCDQNDSVSSPISTTDCSDQRPIFAEHKEIPEVIDEVARIAVAGALDTCGVEYLIHEGQRYYYDINALSVFADNTLIQFAPQQDPTTQFVNLIEERLTEVRRDAA